MKKIFLLSLMSAVLWGCAVGSRPPSLSSDLPINGEPHLRDADKLLGDVRWDAQNISEQKQWVAGFHEPLLSELLVQLDAQNFDIQTATLRLAQARTQVQMAQSGHLPMINGNTGMSRQAQSENAPTNRTFDAMGLPEAQKQKVQELLAEPFNLYTAGIDARWELDLWGRVRHTVEAGQANVLATEAMNHQIRQIARAELMRAYFGWQSTQMQLRSSQAMLNAAQQLVQLNQVKFTKGLIDATLVEQAQMGMDDAAAQLARLQVQSTRYANALTQLLGLSVGALDHRLTQYQHDMTLTQIPVLNAGLLAQVAQRRPDVVQAQAQFQAAVANTGIAVADLYPRITIGGSAGLSTINAETFFDLTSLQWSIGPSLSLPIFDQGRRRNMITLRELDQQQAAINYQKTLLAAWHDIDNSLSQYRASRTSTQKALDKSLQAAQLYDQMQTRYRYGLVDKTVLLNAQIQRDTQRITSAQSLGNAFSDGVMLYKNLGGGYQD